MTQTLLFIIAVWIGCAYSIKYGNRAKKDIEKYEDSKKKEEQDH